MKINVALDGPSGAGKSTIAKAVAKKLEYVYVDTDALYRTIAYYVISTGVDTKDETAVCACLDKISISLEYIGGAQHVMLNGEDVSDKIRTPEISMGASAVSAIPKVREFLFGLQQDIAKKNNIITESFMSLYSAASILARTLVCSSFIFFEPENVFKSPICSTSQAAVDPFPNAASITAMGEYSPIMVFFSSSPKSTCLDGLNLIQKELYDGQLFMRLTAFVFKL